MSPRWSAPLATLPENVCIRIPVPNRKRTPSIGSLGIAWSRTSTMRGWSDVGWYLSRGVLRCSHAEAGRRDAWEPRVVVASLRREAIRRDHRKRVTATVLKSPRHEGRQGRSPPLIPMITRVLPRQETDACWSGKQAASTRHIPS